MKLDALEHPKTLDFASRIGVTRPTAIGHLELLWAFVGKHAPQGDVGKWPDGAIARACDWMGPADVFVDALRDASFIDAHPAHRLTIHDWAQHAPRWVKSKLKTLGLTFVEAATETPSADESSSSDDDEPDISGDVSPPTSGDSKGSEVKGREAKRGERRSRDARATRLPADFSLTPERRAVAEAETLPADRTFAKFCDYWRSVSGEKGRKLDWDGTWRNWCRNEADYRRPGKGHQPAEPLRTWVPPEDEHVPN